MKAWAGLGAVLLIGGTGCGDDDSGGLAGSGSGSGLTDQTDPAGGGTADTGGDPGVTDLDLCSLLETSEIEAEFGERGAVKDGHEEMLQCTWDVGTASAGGTWGVSVGDLGPATGMPPEDYFATFRDLAGDAADVEGVGDEAYFEEDPQIFQSYVTFRVGENVLSVDAYFDPEVEGTQEKLTTLAEHVVSRL